jgi:transposase
MVLDRLKEYPSVWAAAQALGPEVGGGARDAGQVGGAGTGDQGQRSGPSSEELAEIKGLRAENRDLKEVNEILKSASIFFARALDPRHP